MNVVIIAIAFVGAIGIFSTAMVERAEAQQPQAAMPAAAQQQQLSPKEAADEAIIVQMETNYRDAYAQAIALDAQGKALAKQNQDLQGRLTEADKRLNEALAEVAELKGRAAGKAQQTPMPPKQ